MKGKMFGHRMKKRSSMNAAAQLSGNAKDNPPNYEGKEHVKYRDPGYSRHDIRFPQDEPHMKSHVTRDEEHEMEDNFHMDVPDQTETELAPKLKRARMAMDAPNQQDPKPLRGNITHNVPYEGEEDTSGEEEMGPNDMQKNGGSKERRKKMIVSVMRRKMKKRDESPGQESANVQRNYAGIRGSTNY